MHFSPPAELFGEQGLIVLIVVALVLFGSTQIPKLARSLGSAQKEFKKGLDDGAAADAGQDETATVEAVAPTGVTAPVHTPVTTEGHPVSGRPGLRDVGSEADVPFLSPAKLLVILVIALVVLGPDKLPKVAKQVGACGGLPQFREKLESEVRGSFPDLPSTQTITQAVRSPLSFLDGLAESPRSENE